MMGGLANLLSNKMCVIFDAHDRAERQGSFIKGLAEVCL